MRIGTRVKKRLATPAGRGARSDPGPLSPLRNGRARRPSSPRRHSSSTPITYARPTGPRPTRRPRRSRRATGPCRPCTRQLGSPCSRPLRPRPAGRDDATNRRQTWDMAVARELCSPDGAGQTEPGRRASTGPVCSRTGRRDARTSTERPRHPPRDSKRSPLVTSTRRLQRTSRASTRRRRGDARFRPGKSSV
jgi:hypothetical protein